MPKANGNHVQEQEQLAVMPPAIPLSEDIEKVLIQGDLSKLTPDQRLAYYKKLCESLKLNPYTRPFDYLTLGGKLVLYAKKDTTDQLRKIHGVSVDELTESEDEARGVYKVIARGHDRTGRKDTGLGAVSTIGLKGDALANAQMKAETKAKRRMTLSICGLGMLDETETETVKGAVLVDGETFESKKLLPRPPARKAKQNTTENTTEVKAKEVRLEEVKAEEAKPEPEVKPLSFPVRFWRAAKQTQKSDQEIRQYLGLMGYEKTSEVPPGKQQEDALDWAASG